MQTRTYMALLSTMTGYFANTGKIITPELIILKTMKALSSTLLRYSKESLHVLSSLMVAPPASRFGSVSHAGVAETAELCIA